MKAILINSIERTVTELTLDGRANMLQQWYKAMNVELVQVGHYINEHDSVLVDEEGLLKQPEHFFEYDGAHQPFAGNGLVVGVDEEGETVGCDISLEEVTAKVTFKHLSQIIHEL